MLEAEPETDAELSDENGAASRSRHKPEAAAEAECSAAHELHVHSCAYGTEMELGRARDLSATTGSGRHRLLVAAVFAVAVGAASNRPVATVGLRCGYIPTLPPDVSARVNSLHTRHAHKQRHIITYKKEHFADTFDIIRTYSALTSTAYTRPHYITDQMTSDASIHKHENIGEREGREEQWTVEEDEDEDEDEYT